MSNDPFAFRRMLPGAAKESLLRMNFLYQAAYHLHALYPDNAGMTRHLMYQLKHISRRQVLRVHPSIKRGCCKYCHSLMTPGLTTKVRYKRRLDKVVTITCDECGRARTYNNRRSYRRRNQASKESDSEPEAMDIDEPTSPVSDMEFELPEPVHPSVPELEPLELKDLLYKIVFIFPSEKTEEKWSKLEEKWPKLAKLWNDVVADPQDFEAWMTMLDLIDRKDKLSYARVAYEEFFRLYPYCYGYWTKYAEIEIRHQKNDKAKEVYELAVKAVPLSCYVWLAYIQFSKSHVGEAENAEELIRNLYERALAAAGQDYQSDELWSSYIAWEKDNGQVKNVTEIYDRLIRLPLEKWQTHFTDFKQFVDENQPIEMFPLDAYLKIRAAVTNCPKFDAAETKQIRKQIIKNRMKQHWSTERDFTKRAVFESGIKRPYFHVAPMKLKQLYNWDAYLDYEMNCSGEHKVKLLFERCVIVCALYEDFWLKYVDWTERRGDTESARNIFRRACTIHLIRKPRVHLAWAAFEERNGNAELAWEILKNIDYQLPGMVELVMARVSLARRRGTHQVAVRLFADSIEQTEDVTTKQYYIIKYSRYLDQIMKEKERAATVLEEALETDPMNLRLITALIDLKSDTDTPDDDQRVISLYDRVAASADVSESLRQVALRRRFEYSENSAGSATWLLRTHYEQYFMTRDLARQHHDQRIAEVVRKREEEERVLAEEESRRLEEERLEAEMELAREVADDADDEEDAGRVDDDESREDDQNVGTTSTRDDVDSQMTSTRPRDAARPSRTVVNERGRRSDSVLSSGRRDSTDSRDSGGRRERRPSTPRDPSITATASQGRERRPSVQRDPSITATASQGRERRPSVQRDPSITATSSHEWERRPSSQRDPSITATTSHEWERRPSTQRDLLITATTSHSQERDQPGARNGKELQKERQKYGEDKFGNESREMTNEEKERQVARKKKHEELKLRSIKLLMQKKKQEDMIVKEDGEVEDIEPPPQVKAEQQHSLKSEQPSPFIPSLPDMPPISSNPPLPPGTPPSLHSRTPTSLHSRTPPSLPSTPPDLSSRPPALSPRPVRPRGPLVPTMAMVPGIPVPVPVLPLVPLPQVPRRRSSDTEEGEVNPPQTVHSFHVPTFMQPGDLPPSCSFRVKPLFLGNPHIRPGTSQIRPGAEFRAGPGPSHLPPQPTVVSKPKKAKKEKKKKEKKEKKREKNPVRPSTSGLEDISDEEEGEIR